jgi:ABC-type arginine/histidine transport system permease subunit
MSWWMVYLLGVFTPVILVGVVLVMGFVIALLVVIAGEISKLWKGGAND